jgi:hypothetical protein
MAITIVMRDGLGNQLFQYASARALALSHRTSLVLDLRNYVDITPGSSRWSWILDFPIKAKLRTYPSQWFFRGLVPRTLQRIANPIRHFQKGFGYDPQLRDQTDGTVLFGFYQSPHHFRDCYDRFADELDPARIPGVADNPAIRDLALNSAVGVHVRRGDYVGTHHFEMKDSDDYYRAAMAEVRQRGERAVVFSDDIAWCREQEVFAGASFYPANDAPPYFDLHAMRCCQRLVIANSTFSWWAGWLAHRRGAEVVAPKNWTLGYSSEEFGIIPLGWRVL